MEAQWFLDIISGLACVVICFLLWILFRIERQLQELGLRVGLIEKDLQEMFEETGVRKEETGNKTDGDSADKSMSGRLEKIEEIIKKTSNKTDSLEKRIGDSVEGLAGRLEKMEESIQNSSKITETLQERTLDISGKTVKMEEQIESSFTMSKSFEGTLESIQSDILELRTKMTTVPLYRYLSLKNGDHFYTTNWNELGEGKNCYRYEGVTGHLFSSPSNPTETFPIPRPNFVPDDYYRSIIK